MIKRDVLEAYRKGAESGTMISATPNVVLQLLDEIDRLTNERDDAQLTLASLCDFINTWARECGSAEAPRCGLDQMRRAIDGVVFALQRRAAKAAEAGGGQ